MWLTIRQLVRNMHAKYEQLHGELTELKAKINAFIAKEIEKQYTQWGHYVVLYAETLCSA